MDGGGAAAPPFCAVCAPPRPGCEVGPLGGHRAPSAGKTQHRAQQIRGVGRGATPKRIVDRPRAVPPGWGEAQTDFGPPHPQDASPSCGSGTPTPVVRWRSRDVVRWRFPRPRLIASGQATTYWGRQIAYPNAQFPTPIPGPGPGTDGVHPAQQRPPRDAEEDRKRGGGRPRTPGAGSTRQEQATRSWGWGQTRLSRLFVFYGSGAPRRGTCTDPAAPAARGSAPVACLEVQNASEFQARTGAGRAHGPKCV